MNLIIEFKKMFNVYHKTILTLKNNITMSCLKKKSVQHLRNNIVTIVIFTFIYFLSVYDLYL